MNDLLSEAAIYYETKASFCAETLAEKAFHGLKQKASLQVRLKSNR